MSRPESTGDRPGGVTVPGARLPLHDAGANALAGRSVAAADVASSVSAAGAESARDAGAALAHGRSGVARSLSAGGERLVVSFQEVEAMTGDIVALSRDATELAARTARIAIDPDLLASCSVSPVTGMTAEAAICAAAAGLARTAVEAGALAVATGAIASSYAAADAWLAAAAGSLRASAEATAGLTRAGIRAGIGFAGGVAGGAATVAEAQVGADLGVAVATADAITDLGAAAVAGPALLAGGVAAVANGFGTEAARSLAAAFEEANAAFGGAGDAPNPFAPSDVVGYASVLAAGFDRTFSLDDALADSVGGVQALLGATGPLYDDILAGLVTAGVAVGFFHDGDVTVAPTEDVDPRDLERSLARSADALGVASDEFGLVDGRIIPDGWMSALAGLAQLDDLGGSRQAIIRVFTVLDDHGQVVSHRVQIPSTASWEPNAGAHGSPADVTSDVYSMLQGSDAALAESVYEAMRQAGIATGEGAPPVELDGFSLGGITAAAVAAEPRGYNITEIHTAGSPIGATPIADGVRVYSLEAQQDLVAALDGRENPRRDSWQTVVGPGVPTADEKVAPPMLPGTVHDARRYAVMGAASGMAEVGAMRVPVGGSVTVEDFSAVRGG